MEQAPTPNTSTDSTDGGDSTGPATGGAHFETPPPPPPVAPPAPSASAIRRLSRTEGPISGVSGGIADYFGIDPTLVRLGLVAATLFTGPVVPIAYVAAWLIVPEADPTPVAPIMTPPAVTPVPHPDAPAPAPVDTTATDTPAASVG
ncbi:MAG: PspC domain-containing protein [Actinomycetota bacterium]